MSPSKKKLKRGDHILCTHTLDVHDVRCTNSRHTRLLFTFSNRSHIIILVQQPKTTTKIDRDSRRKKGIYHHTILYRRRSTKFNFQYACLVYASSSSRCVMYVVCTRCEKINWLLFNRNAGIKTLNEYLLF